MAEAELKTRPTEASVDVFIDALPDERQRDDCRALVRLMGGLTKSPPKMWGPSIIGFGETRLKYASGRELDWMRCGFSPRKGHLSIHLTCDIARYEHHLARLGKHKTGKGCLHIKRLADVDMRAMKELVRAAVKSG